MGKCVDGKRPMLLQLSSRNLKNVMLALSSFAKNMKIDARRCGSNQ